MKDMTVEILTVVPDRAAVDAMLDGWQDAMTAPNSIAWVRERVLHPPAASGGHRDAGTSTVEVPGANPDE
jgi:hypothetical protein